MVIVSKNDFIWVEPLIKGKFSCPIGAKVTEVRDDGVKVVDDQGQEEWLGADRKIRLMHPTCVQGVEDMIQLGELHESSIIRNLSVRYSERLIYTFTGSILIAMNPYMDLPIYTSDQIRLYRNHRIGELPPHIFAIADNAYCNVRKSSRDQCIVISGESGAGKTESTKIVLQFLATVSGQHSWIEQQILESNPIMEAFGNAKTIKNDNSSRFGKYIDIYFNSKGAIEGAKIQKYLLEKSRIVNQNIHERNYHIFYCLLTGLSSAEKSELFLNNIVDFCYLAQGNHKLEDGRNEPVNLAEIRSAMKILMFKESEIWSIFKILAALLHIGNIKYSAATINNIEATEINDLKGINRVGSLLQLDERSLVNALITKSIIMRGERVISCLTAEQSLDVRDALVKGIYGRLFDYIINRINNAIYRQQREGFARQTIGLLDIFGFENFETNNFEQLCINYANENLKQFFVHNVFKMEQKNYDNEKINWRPIKFLDNVNVLEMIAGCTMSIMSIIDEESIFPKGTDQTMLNKLHVNHGRNEQLYIKPKSDLNKSFGINHYAGIVIYNTKGFLEKNRDTFSSSLVELVHSSKFKFFVNLFDDDSIYETMTATRRKQITVGGQFRKSLESLMMQLSQCQPFFIKCIKPNELKRPMMFDRNLVCKQIRYTALMETINIRKSGYPVRYSYESFVYTYRVLLKGIGQTHKIDCYAATQRICDIMLGIDADYQLGLTKVFLKATQELYLQQERERAFNNYSMIIQKTIRGYIHRKQFINMKNAAIVIQKYWRGYAQRKHYKQMRIGFTRLQAVLRSRKLVLHYKCLRSIVVRFQAHCRGALIRNELRTKCARGERHPAMMVQEDTVSQISIVNMSENGDIDDQNLVEQMFGFLPKVTPLQSPVLSVKNSVNIQDTVSERTSSQRPSLIPSETSCSEDLNSYQFGKFAATYFQGHATACYTNKVLRVPLLHHSNITDQMASLSIWITILRFMGDLPEPDNISQNGDTRSNSKGRSSVMSRLNATLGRSLGKREADGSSQGSDYESQISQKFRRSGVGKKLLSMTMRRKSKNYISHEEKATKAIIEYSNKYGTLFDEERTTNLEKLHFIIGHGILRPELRDEIYCQICKQLISNPTKVSNARGWILLSLCVGCFAPSERFMKYFHCFVRENAPVGNVSYAKYIENRLNRTIKNGARHQPPSYVELQAIKLKRTITLAVTLMDGSVKAVNADSATTSRELCEALADRIALNSRFGFSIYIALFDKVSSLGSENDHIMDAISQCEQYVKEEGKEEKSAQWRLFFRKEIFAPWHDPKEDPVGNNLIYQQVIRGLHFGEYRTNKEEDVALLAAKQYYIDKDADMEVDELSNSIKNYIPEHILSEDNAERWLHLVLHAYRKRFSRLNMSPEEVKEEIVLFAKNKWPLLFSRFYEGYKYSGPALLKNEVIIAVNWTGIFIVDDEERILLELSFPEIIDVTLTPADKRVADYVTISIISGDEYTFQSPNADDIKTLVTYFLKGLRQRSRYVVALRNNNNEEMRDMLEFNKGDLLILHDQTEKKNRNLKAENTRTGLQGILPSDAVQILPTLIKPSVEIMDLFTRKAEYDSPMDQQVVLMTNHVGIEQPYTLQKFAADHFRSNAPQNSLGLISRQSERHSSNLWAHSYEPIKTPLLKKLEGKAEPSKEAILGYLAIMVYMGDYIPKHPVIGIQLTDQIFTGPLKYEVLRDEVYCQLMKQLTDNYNRFSEERGWELFWLCVGLFAPSQSLLKEVVKFLRTRKHSTAIDCHNRLQKTLRSGQRKYPPHQVEIEAIQHRTTQIFHKVYFPNGAEEAVEVDSSMKARDYCTRIANKVGLRSADGFSLFVKCRDKVISVPQNDFFFDFVRHLSEWVGKSNGSKDDHASHFSYQVFYMKKLWINTVPGEDQVADLVFYYPQELPKYLRGYHTVTKQQSVELAALILRARIRGNKLISSQQLGALLNELVPHDLIIGNSIAEWKKLISTAYTGKIETSSPEEAKLVFLKTIAQWPTFGSAFFEVKQSSDATISDHILIAINKYGVNLYNAENKEFIINYPFQAISNWTSGNTYFHMTIGNLMKGSRGSRLFLETTLGYKMDDLLTSYIQALLSNSNDSNNNLEQK